MNDPDDRVYDLEELDELVPEILLIEAWVDAIKARILASLEGGAVMKHAWLEPKRGTRKWIRDEKFIAKEIDDVLVLIGKPSGEDVTRPREVVSPAVAEKLVGKAKFAALLSSLTIIQSSGGMNLKLGE